MSVPDPTVVDLAEAARREVRDRWVAAGAGDLFARCDGPDLEAYCGQVALVRDSSARIAAEGTVIADPKGNPIPHPCVEIGRRAQAEVRAWAGRFDPPRTRH